MRARDAKQKATADAKAEARGPQINDEAYNARMAAMYREVVLKEKPIVAERVHSIGCADEAEWRDRSGAEGGDSGAGGGGLLSC